MSLAHHVSSLWNSNTPPTPPPCPAPTPQPNCFYLLRSISGPTFFINISLMSPTWEASSFCEPHCSCISTFSVVHLHSHYSFSFRLYFSHGPRQCINYICFPCSYKDVLYTTSIRQKRNEPK